MQISFKNPVTFSQVGSIYPLKYVAGSFNSCVTFLRWIALVGSRSPWKNSTFHWWLRHVLFLQIFLLGIAHPAVGHWFTASCRTQSFFAVHVSVGITRSQLPAPRSDHLLHACPVPGYLPRQTKDRDSIKRRRRVGSLFLIIKGCLYFVICQWTVTLACSKHSLSWCAVPLDGFGSMPWSETCC